MPNFAGDQCLRGKSAASDESVQREQDIRHQIEFNLDAVRND